MAWKMSTRGVRTQHERFFVAHQDDFTTCLNLDVLIPKLNSKEMLTIDEMEMLNLCQTTQRKTQQFVQIMCRKGEKAPDLFLQCLRSATDHLPHSDLVDKMEQWLREHSESADTPTTCTSSEYFTTTQQHFPAPQSSQGFQLSKALPMSALSSDQQLTTATSTFLATVNNDVVDTAATPPNCSLSNQPASSPLSQPSTLTTGTSEQSTTTFPTVNVNVHIHNPPDHQSSVIVSTYQELTPGSSVATVSPNSTTQLSFSSSSNKTLAQPEQYSWPNTQPPIQQTTLPAETMHILPIQEQSIIPQPSQYSRNVTPNQKETPHMPIMTPQFQAKFQPPIQESSVHAPHACRMGAGTQHRDQTLQFVGESHVNTTSIGDKRSTAPSSDDPDLGPSSNFRPRVTYPGSKPASTEHSASYRGYKTPPLSSNMSDPPCRQPRTSPPHHHQGLTPLASHQSSREFAQQYIPSTFSTSLSDSPLQVLAKTLRATYESPTLFKKAAGLDAKPKFINLALIKKQNVNFADKEKDEFLKSTLHGSVNDIVKKKKDIQIQTIFAYDNEVVRKLVLVEGAPGVGKTMLALRICQMWARGELLNEEYDIVLLVTLRRFQRKFNVKLNDIVNISLEDTISDKSTEALFRSTGKRVLIILEGWDELPPELREEGSFFFDIIEGNKLPNASVLVTSRPTVTADLYDYMDERHIEVLGFNSDQITEYVQTNGKDKAENIIRHLEKFPNLKALAHIPLTLSIICLVASKEQVLPHTLTELYDQYICNTILKNVKKQPGLKLKSLVELTSLDELPDEIKAVIQSLSTLALNGFKEKKFFYSLDDLQEVGLTAHANKSCYGLLNIPLNSSVVKFENVFQFNHLSTQKFLAAFKIKELECGDRIFLLRQFRKDKQFQDIWKFFSGITRLEDKDFSELALSETGKATKDQLFILHCLYEANDQVISRDAAKNMSYVLNLNNIFLNLSDCLCVAHMITSAGGEWSVDLRACNIGEEGLRIISTSLLSHIEEHGVDGFAVTCFDLTHNRLKASSLTYLADMLTTDMQLQGLVLASNNFGDRGMKVLTDALKKNKTMKVLQFSSCELTTVGGGQLAEVLEVNETITEICIGFEPLGSEGVTRLALAMEKNHTLTELSLTKTEMTSVGLAALAETLKINNTLQVLRLDRNDLQASDCKLVTTIIEKNNSLILIDLSKNPIGDDGFEMLLEALIAKPTSSLKKLGVFGCEITNKGLEKLVQFFTVTQTFVGIQLGCNELGDEGAKLIGEALLENSKSSNTVKQVLLETTGVSDKGKKKLEKICDSINSGRDSDNKLDVNYKHHSQVVEKRNSTNYL